MENQEQTTITELQPVRVPLTGLRAALSCASQDPSRYYLQGVFLHVHEGDYRLVGTDGARMLVYSVPVGSDPVPLWAEKGVIISADSLKERLQLLAKLAVTTATIAYQLEAPRVVISDHGDNTVFKVLPVNGTYPDYGRILAEIDVFVAREGRDMESTAFQAASMKGVGDLAKLLGSDHVRMFSGRVDIAEKSADTKADPTIITFPGCPEAVLIQMPVTSAYGAIGSGAAKVLAAPIKSSIAALTALRTRRTNRLEKADAGEVKLSKTERAELEREVETYTARIEAMTANAIQPALPAPEPEAFPAWGDYFHAVRVGLAEAGHPADDIPAPLRDWYADNLPVAEAVARIIDGLTTPAAVSGDLTGAENPEGIQIPPGTEQPTPGPSPAASEAVKEQTDDDRRHHRAVLSSKGRKLERRRFVADINAALSANHGLTIGQLSEGVPIDDWFDGGLTALGAALRCLDWRKPIERTEPKAEQPEGETAFAIGEAVEPKVEPEAEADHADQPELADAAE